MSDIPELDEINQQMQEEAEALEMAKLDGFDHLVDMLGDRGTALRDNMAVVVLMHPDEFDGPEIMFSCIMEGYHDMWKAINAINPELADQVLETMHKETTDG